VVSGPRAEGAGQFRAVEIDGSFLGPVGVWWPARPPRCPTLTRTKVRRREGRDERHHPHDRATPTTQGAPGTILAHQLTPQRRGDTPAVLRALAHHQQPRPTTQVQPMLRDCPPPLGVHLAPATPHQLAVDITKRAPRRTAQSISPATVEGVVLRPRLDRSGSRALLSPHRQMRPRLRPRAAVGRPPPREDVSMEPRPRGLVHTKHGIWLRALDRLRNQPPSQSATNRARRTPLPGRDDA
jgi:hypothetical protein